MARVQFAKPSRWSIAALLTAAIPLLAAEPQPGLTCEQIYDVVKDSARHRNQGQTLDQVLRGLKEIETPQPLTKIEAEALRKAVSLVYMGDAAPEEIALECVNTRKKK